MKTFSPTVIACIFSLILGTIAEGHGAHDELVGECLEKLEKNPGDQELRHRLAMAYVHHGDGELALEELDKLNSSAIDSRLTRARALVLCRLHEDARKLLDDLLEKSPGNPQALLERARVFAALKEPAASLTDYREALKLTAKPLPEFCLEIADALMLQSHTEEALAALTKGISTQGERTNLVTRMMEIEITAGKYDAALSRIAVLEKQAPRPEPWMARRAELLAQAGRKEESRAAWSVLKDRISALPNLERGTPDFLALAAKAGSALSSH